MIYSLTYPTGSPIYSHEPLDCIDAPTFRVRVTRDRAGAAGLGLGSLSPSQAASLSEFVTVTGPGPSLRVSGFPGCHRHGASAR